MHHHPALVGPVIRERLAGLHHCAESEANRRHDGRSRAVIQAATQPIGWLLIEVGLRLAVPRDVALTRDTLVHRGRSA